MHMSEWSIRLITVSLGRRNVTKFSMTYNSLPNFLSLQVFVTWPYGFFLRYAKFVPRNYNRISNFLKQKDQWSLFQDLSQSHTHTCIDSFFFLSLSLPLSHINFTKTFAHVWQDHLYVYHGYVPVIIQEKSQSPVEGFSLLTRKNIISYKTLI